MNKISKNSIASGLTTLLNAAFMFATYKLVMSVLGAEALGIWALVLAFTSVSRLAEFGFATGIVKFVAGYEAQKDYQRAKDFVDTGILTIAAVAGCLMVLVYPLIIHYAANVIPSSAIEEFEGVLPIAMLSVVFLACSNVVLGALEGLQKYVLRTQLFLLSGALNVISVWVLLPEYGLHGLAVAQFLQSLCLLTTSCIVLSHQHSSYGILPVGWKWEEFKKLISFGVKLQLGSISLLAFDPISKIFLANQASLASVAYYEMANQLVTRVRAILATGNQVVVPEAARISSADGHEKVMSLYMRNVSVITFLAVPGFALLAASSPLIAQLWIGTQDSTFIFCTIVLSIGWLLNTLASPAYFISIGIGKIGFNILAQVSIGLCNLILCIVLSPVYGIFGVLLSATCSLLVGFLILITSFHIQNDIKISAQSFSSYMDWVLLGSASVATYSFVYFYIGSSVIEKTFSWASALCVLSLVFVAFSIYVHHNYTLIFKALRSE